MAGRRKIEARFDGGTISSDGGAVLLGEAERRTRIVERFARCFVDRRDPTRVEHSVRELAMQRVLGLCLGYEDLIDRDALRSDPLLAALSGKRDPRTALAGKSTLSRLELSTDEAERHEKLALDTQAVDRLLVDVFVESSRKAPDRIVIDLDATDFPLHGDQQGRFFHRRR
ncbi:MAG: transposase [Planctomycetes bacterium]|nr:transposase [Planctomycetota bacterium]